MGAAFITLTIEEIALINRRMIEVFGGLLLDEFNFKNKGSLEHALWQIEGSLFGEELHPDTIEKAAVLGWRIITGHIFHDGNKRTGMEACRLLLELNGYALTIDQEAVDIALNIAQGKVE